MDRTKWLIFAVIFALIGAHIYHILGKKAEVIEIEKTDTIVVNDTITQRDTITITKTKQVYKEIVKTDTVFNEKGDTIQLVTENKLYKDTLCSQNDSIILESSITGINPRLDWIKADWRKQEIIKTVTITNYVKPSKIKITPQLGIGYGLFSKKIDAYGGVGISINL